MTDKPSNRKSRRLRLFFLGLLIVASLLILDYYLLKVC